MKKNILIWSLIWLGFLVSYQSRGTHILGSEISYQATGPGVFVATYRCFRDGNISLADSTVTMNLRAPGCGNGFVITGRRVSSTAFHINGNNSNCNNQIVYADKYTATFALSLSQFSCPEWFLSVQQCQVAPGANFVQNPNTCITVEATLTPMTVNFQLGSPIFFSDFSWIFNLNQPATFSNYAYMNNGQPDSVVYSLKPALSDHNTPLAYAPNFTFQQPVPSSSGVALDSRTGLLTFTPHVYNSSPASLNRYGVVVEATAYRHINGQIRKTGAAQHWLPIYLVSNPANINPELVNVTANGKAVQPNEVVPVYQGQTLIFQFNTADANATDNLNITLPGPQFPGLPFNLTHTSITGPRPTGALNFSPFPAGTGQVYYFPVSVMDDACPQRAVTTRMYGIKVMPNPLGTFRPHSSETSFTAFPNPFSEDVTFRIQSETKVEKILIFNLLGQPIAEIPLKTVGLSEQNVQWPNAGKYGAGTYVAQLISEGKTVQTLKFTKLP